jgi:hypothetical protein
MPYLRQGFMKGFTLSGYTTGPPIAQYSRDGDAAVARRQLQDCGIVQIDRGCWYTQQISTAHFSSVAPSSVRAVDFACPLQSMQRSWAARRAPSGRCASMHPATETEASHTHHCLDSSLTHRLWSKSAKLATASPSSSVPPTASRKHGLRVLRLKRCKATRHSSAISMLLHGTDSWQTWEPTDNLERSY